MATEASTRQKLHNVIDDMELISKELIEQLAKPKSQRGPDAPDTSDLMELLIEKDTEMKELLKTAEEQEKVQKVMDGLRAEVNKRDGEIKHLQRALKEAETIMATAVYQAKQKLASVRQAQKNKVQSEDLIKYAHRISASNAVAAPSTWGPGDPRRPYPTDLEMRHSFLSSGTFPDSSGPSASTSTPGAGSISRLYSHESQGSHSHHSHPTPPQQLGHPHAAASSHHQQSSLHPPLHPTASSSLGSQQPSQPGQGPPPPYNWQSSQDSATTLNSHASILDGLKGHSKDEDFVELMSSDSSSSSSSDE